MKGLRRVLYSMDPTHFFALGPLNTVHFVDPLESKPYT